MQACLDVQRHDSKNAASDTLDGVSSVSLLDLRQWVDLPMLRYWIEAETEQLVPWKSGSPLMRAEVSDRFRKMLALLCFAYSTALTRSSEIVEACRREPEFRAIAAGFRPFADEVKNFRRRYRPLLEVVLLRIFMHTALLNPEFARETLPRGLESRARDVLNLARHLDSCDDC